VRDNDDLDRGTEEGKKETVFKYISKIYFTRLRKPLSPGVFIP
jgi:hypothetical protein